ncbi:Microfibrillar-associated protein 1 [Globodera pallida]|nr:Microfibrillar-associated protein 1 [Globodera pallida]
MGDFVPKFERNLDSKPLGPRPLPTAGAIPVKDEKGRIVMKKVKVQRYMAGKVPEFARDSESDEDFQQNNEEENLKEHREEKRERELHRHERRDKERDRERGEHRHGRKDDKNSIRRRDRRDQQLDEYKRELKEEEAFAVGEEEEEEDEQTRDERHHRALIRRRRMEQDEAPLEQEDLEEEADEASTNAAGGGGSLPSPGNCSPNSPTPVKSVKRVRKKVRRERRKDSEEEMMPRLKPVFVPRNDRVTLIELEKEQAKLEQLKFEEEKRKEEKKRLTARLVEEQLKREVEQDKAKREEGAQLDLAAVNTDDESEEIAYELWKVREMKRLKRNREEREALARDKEEMERIHNMTEEERRNYLRMNPKIITNQQNKGKYKFLQKYYHRGAFFLDKEDDVLRRNFAEATGEDVFDKSVLPKVMQWTHLTAEDTTDHQGVWATPTPLSAKFVAKYAAGMKNVFEKPSAKKRKIAGD